MSELTEAKDHIDRKKIENRKLLDAAERVVFALPIPDKAKLLCLYFLRTCDWLSLTRDEGRVVLAQILGCSEDQVSRYTRPLNESGIIRIVSCGSNVTGRVHTYRIELDHGFWTGDQEEVGKIAEELSRRTNKRGPTTPQTSRTRHRPNAAIAEHGHLNGRTRPLDQPNAATQMAEHAALPLLPPSFPSSPLGLGGGDSKSEQIVIPSTQITGDEFSPWPLPDLPVQVNQITDNELTQIVATHGLVKPADLINRFPHSSHWSAKLRCHVETTLSGTYYFQVFDGRYEVVRSYCPNDAKIILMILLNYVGDAPSDPMSLKIKHLYPNVWPEASSGDLAVDEEKAALDWLKDWDRSGTHSDFLNSKRQQVLDGKPLSPKQREAVIRNWKEAVGKP